MEEKYFFMTTHNYYSRSKIETGKQIRSLPLKKVRFSFVPKIDQSNYLYTAKIPKLAKLHAVLNAVTRDMV